MSVCFDSKKKTYFCKFRYKNWDGKTKETTKRGFSTKREAKQYEVDFKRKAAGIPTMTVEQLVDILMASLRKRLKPASIRQKEMIYRLYVVEPLGSMAIADVTPQVIRSWQDNLPQKAPSTILAINTAFSSLLNYGVKFHGLASNPFQVAGKTGSAGKKIDFWEHEQFLKFIKIVDNKMYHAVFNLFYYSGLRRGELLALTVDDVDFENNTINVDKSMDDYGRVLPPKSKSSIRVVTLPDFIMNELKDWRETLKEPPKQFFLTSYAMLKVAFNKYRNMTDLPYISLHGLRHSHVSFLIKSGVPITGISSRIGHRNSQVTLSVYSHQYKSADKDIAKMLENTSKN